MFTLTKVLGTTALALAFGALSAGAAGAATSDYTPQPYSNGRPVQDHSGPTIRDHRTPTGPTIRDHRKPTGPIVRDHRKPTGPIVRDHRTPQNPWHF